MEMPKFNLQFVNHEKHLLLPNISSIILAQNLYDILFQYAISEEKEEKLKNFISVLEAHIKSKSRAPFSLPLSELEFLEEGLEELKLLNWLEVPVARFELQVEYVDGDQEEQFSSVLNFLESIIIFNRKTGSNYLNVYPDTLAIY